ncbi:unnamed protein product [Didymodactylos carnosus]|uniref:F-box domain-containing protein n=1 Tax=Didymodactylos carnosus TaxID=1234261 RepID=A0A815EGH7_9BILA|nr:unnamed protein product [Didymodactylos carnosus]CAF4148603.1 unnamed protein product [Didymodactylos carnosus]
MSNFEILPNELLFDIFKYLTSFELYHTFYNLNYRFNSLFKYIDQHFDLTTEYLSYLKFKYYCQNIIPLSINQICSLKLSNENTIDAIKLFYSIFNFEKLLKLKTLILIKPNSIDLKYIIPKLLYIKKLSIISGDFFTNDNIERELLLKLIFNLKTLKICHLPEIQLNDLDKLNKSTIENLTIDLCTINTLNRLFYLLPNIKQLMVNISCYKTDSLISYNDSLLLLVPKLIYLKLNIFSLDFLYIEQLLINLPQLKKLSFKFSYSFDFHQVTEYIDAQRWNKIFSLLPNLIKIDFILHVYISPIFDDETLRLDWMTKHKLSIIFEHYKNNAYVNFLNVYTVPLKQTTINLYTNLISKININLPINYHPNVKKIILTINGDLDEELNKIFIKDNNYYKNVNSLIINAHIYPFQSSNLIIFLNSKINWLKLEYLQLIGRYCTFELLIKFIEYAPNIHSLTLYSSFELYQYGKIQQIRTIHLAHQSYENLLTIENIINTYPNLESFIGSIEKFHDFKRAIKLLMKNLPKLLYLQLKIVDKNFTEKKLTRWLKNKQKKLFSNSYYQQKLNTLNVWK